MELESRRQRRDRPRHAASAVVEGIVEPIAIDFGAGEPGPKKQPRS